MTTSLRMGLPPARQFAQTLEFRARCTKAVKWIFFNLCHWVNNVPETASKSSLRSRIAFHLGQGHQQPSRAVTGCLRCCEGAAEGTHAQAWRHNCKCLQGMTGGARLRANTLFDSSKAEVRARAAPRSTCKIFTRGSARLLDRWTHQIDEATDAGPLRDSTLNQSVLPQRARRF